MSDPSLRLLIQSFKYGGESLDVAKVSKASSPKRKKQKTVTEASGLKDLPPSLSADLTLLFIGFNPGVESSKQQHHYAHPTNLFWKLFNNLDILDRVLGVRNIMKDDAFLRAIYEGSTCKATARHDNELVHYGIGFTDLVLRCTKTAQELTKQEKIQNVPRLLTEFGTTGAPWIVFIGKGIWEVVVKFLDPKYKLTKDNFNWGFQKDARLVSPFHKHCGYNPSIYVFPNTSGLVALMKYPEKLALWDELASSIT